MFAKEIYIRRRSALCGKMGSGLILIPGNMLTPNNYLNNAYYFRQDSSFLYYFGLNTPALVGLIDADSGEVALYGDDFTVEDIIWTGPQPSLREQGAEAGVSNTFPLADLKTHLTKAIVQGRRIHYLPPYRGETKLLLADLLGLKPAALHDHKSVELMMAVAEMREKKGPEEIEELEKSFHIGYAMHTTAMKMCRPGIVEREIAGTIEGISKAFGRGVSFPPIVSQHGETLHNLHSDGVLQNGRLLLCDAGAEGLSYYCSDHTRKRQVHPETKRHLQHRAGGARPGGRHDRPSHAVHGYPQRLVPHPGRRPHLAGPDARHGGRCRRCRRHDPLHASRTGTRHGPGRARLRSHRGT